MMVALGGAVGASARYGVYLASGHYLGTNFPYATLIVNVVGSFALGALAEAMREFWSLSQEMRLLLTVGMLGAFTTFSTFSLDVAQLYEREKVGLSLIYILVSVVLSIGALFAGIEMVRRTV